MPWRSTNDPYKIWLSEIMLQQTQVKTVIPYYNKWIKKYPTLESVAKSNIDDLLKIWEGLGYYSRCRNFHKASIKIFKDYNGKIPEDFDQFKKLPGVGEYTAGAVLSIAYGKKIPAIDTNILRVMSRILGLKERSKSNLNKIKKNLIDYLSTEKPGDINQALMDLGSMICKNKDPYCQNCIFQDICKAWEVGDPEGFPAKNKKVAVKKILMSSGILVDDELILIAKKKNGIYREMWQFPSVSITSSTKDNLIKKKFKEEFGIKIKSMSLIGSFNHLLSHRNIYVKVFTLSARKTLIESKNLKWIKAKNLNLFPMPNLHKRVFEIFHNYKNGSK